MTFGTHDNYKKTTTATNMMETLGETQKLQATWAKHSSFHSALGKIFQKAFGALALIWRVFFVCFFLLFSPRVSIQTVLYAADSRRFIRHIFLLVLTSSWSYTPYKVLRLTRESPLLVVCSIGHACVDLLPLFLNIPCKVINLYAFFQNWSHHLRHVIPTKVLRSVSAHHTRGLFRVWGAKCFTITTSLLLGPYVCFLKPPVWPFVESSRRLLLLIPRLIRALLSLFSFFWASTFYLFFILSYLVNRQQRLATFPWLPAVEKLNYDKMWWLLCWSPQFVLKCFWKSQQVTCYRFL